MQEGLSCIYLRYVKGSSSTHPKGFTEHIFATKCYLKYKLKTVFIPLKNALQSNLDTKCWFRRQLHLLRCTQLKASKTLCLDVQQAHVVIVTLKILHKNIYSPKTERFLKENTSISNYDAEKLQSSVWYNGQV